MEDYEIEEEVGYQLRETEEVVDDLIQWISETQSEGDRWLMKEDLEYLFSLPDEEIYSSLNTNEYIAYSDDEEGFNKIREEFRKTKEKNCK